jgi:hypothetical protein
MIRIAIPGSGPRIRILIFYPSRIPDPGVKKARDSRIRIRNTENNSVIVSTVAVFFISINKLQVLLWIRIQLN